MDENSVINTPENLQEQDEKVIYSSNVTMTREAYSELSSLNYNRMKVMFGAALCVAVSAGVANFIGGDDGLLVCMLLMSVMSLVLYIVSGRNAKTSYERGILNAGKEASVQHELLEDKIISIGEGGKREWLYTQVTGLFESKNLLLLHLKLNLYIMIDKSTLNADAEEVKAFLIERCRFAKKKKFTNCANDKRTALILLVILIALSVILTAAAMVIKFMYPEWTA